MKWIILLALVTALAAVDDGDFVNANDLPIGIGTVHPFYAGYLHIDPTKAFYYVYTFSFSNPSKDPLIIHISQGPGCSALYSWLYSHG